MSDIYKYYKYKFKYVKLKQNLDNKSELNNLVGGNGKCILSEYGGISSIYRYCTKDISADDYVDTDIDGIIRKPNHIIDKKRNIYWKLQLPAVAWTSFGSNRKQYFMATKNKKTGKYDVPFVFGPNYFVSENNLKIDPFIYETAEQYLCYKWIKSTDIVLEIGGRTGVVSYTINSLLDNETYHVVIEPDNNILHALNTNKKSVNASFSIETKAISNVPLYFVHYGGIGNYVTDILPTDTNLTVTSIDTISLTDLLKKYNLKFNVVVADCEGCLCKIYDDNPDFFHSLDVIIFEMDRQNEVDYTKFIESIKKTHIQTDCMWKNFQQVWIKKYD
jgi:hypothetical protein